MHMISHNTMWILLSSPTKIAMQTYEIAASIYVPPQLLVEFHNTLSWDLVNSLSPTNITTMPTNGVALKRIKN